MFKQVTNKFVPFSYKSMFFFKSNERIYLILFLLSIESVLKRIILGTKLERYFEFILYLQIKNKS